MYRGSETQKECFDTIEIKALTCDTCTSSVRTTKLTSSLPSETGGFWIIWKMDRPEDKRRGENREHMREEKGGRRVGELERIGRVITLFTAGIRMR